MRSHLLLTHHLATGFIVLVLATTSARATTILERQTLDDLVDESERALLGSVIAVEYAYDEHRIPSTFVTLAVEEAIYGSGFPDAGETFRIKVVGAPHRMEDGRQFFIPGTPLYRVGQRYLLLLNGTSEMGFTNTAGLPLGAFRITEEPGGEPVGRSVAGNRLALGEDGIDAWLSEGSPESARASTRPDSPVPYALLRQAVIELQTARGGDLRGRP